jgi:hypothetical protein
LGILGIENRKPKIVNCKAGNNYQKIIFFYFFFRVRADVSQRGEGGASAWTPMSARMLGCVRADSCARPRGCSCVRADAPCPRGRECFTPGNFKKDATVRPSHGRPRGHRSTVGPSVIVRVTTLMLIRKISKPLW